MRHGGAMTEQECAETFDALGKILVEQGLGWLVDAVSREIQEGLIEVASEKDLLFLKNETPRFRFTPEYRRSIKGAEFLVRREFSGADRLRMLVDAVGEVVSQAHEMEHDVLHSLSESGGPTELKFVDTETDRTISEATIKKADRSPAALSQLQTLLNELKQEIAS
jgi:hypothetical protein